MKPLRPFFPYFGSNWRLSKRYPSPTRARIIEPFAGSGCYSLHHHDREVLLADCSQYIVDVWDYLISASKQDILNLPEINTGESVDDFDVCNGAKALIGFWMYMGAAKPIRSTKRTKEALDYMKGRTGFWGPRVKARICDQLESIRHWQVIRSEYGNLDLNNEATWFVDPPYQGAGKAYDWNGIDYEHLGSWCKDLPGQVLVCENKGATWLPFEYFSELIGAPRPGGKHSKTDRVRTEVLWKNES